MFDHLRKLLMIIFVFIGELHDGRPWKSWLALNNQHIQFVKFEFQEAYSVARQFNLIPPICEQPEYNLFQREKIEALLPDVIQKIGLKNKFRQ